MKKSPSKSLKIFLTATLVVALAVGCAFLYAKSKPARIQKRADAYFKSGEYDKARIEYMNLLKASRMNTIAIQQLGIIWFEQGAPLQAFPFLLKSRELAPANLTARTKLAQAFMGIGDIADARKEALAVLEQSPGNEEAMTVFADTARTPEEIEETGNKLAESKQTNSAAYHLALATLSARKWDEETAKAEIRRAVEADPKSSVAHIAMAAIHLAANKKPEAAAELKAASIAAPLRSKMRVQYAEFKAKSGAPDEARALLKETTAAAPDFLPAWRGLAQVAFMEKKYDEALAFLENIFSRDGGNLDGAMLRAQVWMAKGDSKKAVEGMERLSKDYPSLPGVMHQLAVAHLQNANPTQAAAALEKALAANPDYVEATLLLGQVNLRTGKPQLVVDGMLNLLKKRPQLVPAQSLLSEAYRALGKGDAAAKIYKAQSEAAPKNPQIQFLLGMALQQQGKFDEARKAFEKALELAPGNFEIEYQLAGLDLQKKDYAAALERAQRELKKTPTSVSAQLLEGIVYAAQGDWTKAEAALLKTLELDPNSSAAYDALVAGYLQARKLPEAVAKLEQRIAKAPDDMGTLMTLALLYEKINDFSKARDAYGKVLVKNPSAVVALNNLASMYLEHLKDTDKALDLARRAHALAVVDPSLSGAISDTLGWILYRRGDYPQAFTLIQESARKLPDVAEVQYHLAMAAYMAGRTDAALQAFLQVAKAPEKAFAALPAKEEIQRRLSLLGDGSGKAAELSSEELQTMLKAHPEDIFVLLRLAEAFERQRDYPKAASACEQALKLNAKFLPAILKLAELNAGPLQNLPKALELAKAARELDPTDAKTAGILGSVAFRSGDVAWSYTLLQESDRAAKGNAGILHDLAMAAYGLGKVDEARATMQRAIDAKLDGQPLEDARSFLAMTALASRPQDAVAAEPEVLKLLAADSKYVPALVVRAALEMQRSDTKAATATYVEILARFPDFTPAQKDLASLYAKDPENLEKAYTLATKARATLPDDPALTETLAEISYRKKEFARVIQLLQDPRVQKVVSLRTIFFLGMSQVQGQDKPRARETLQKAVAAGLPEPLLAEAQRALTELGTE